MSGEGTHVGLSGTWRPHRHPSPAYRTPPPGHMTPPPAATHSGGSSERYLNTGRERERDETRRERERQTDRVKERDPEKVW